MLQHGNDFTPNIDAKIQLEIHKQVENSADKFMARLDEVSSDLRERQQTDHQHLSSRIQTVEKNLSDKIDKHTAELSRHFDTSLEKLDSKWEARHSGISHRVAVIERWRWLVVGGGVVLMWALSQVLTGRIKILEQFHE